ncbi:MAG: PAS domain S-box protein, partial [Methanogenium sp.]|nr:PAS domain S-box protein [Methanogenium sp.]
GIYDFDDAVNGALADMGRLSRADRDYLCLLRKGGTVLDNTHEWCAKGVSPQIDNLQNIPSEMFPWWTEKIRNREIIHITDVSKLPPEAEAEREILEMQEIRSLIVLPVFCGDEPAGFLGFDSIRETGEWTEEVILRTVAEIIGKSLELKRMQSVLEESKERFRSLATSTPVAVMIYRDDRFMYANPAAEEISGYSEAELCQMNIWDIVHPDYVNLIKERGRARQRGEKTVNRYEFKIITKAGKEKWVDISGDSVLLDDRPAGIISLLDITDRKKTEEELQRSENFYRTIFESTSAPTVILGEDTTILLANSAYENLSGFSKDEVEGKKSWTGFIVKEDLEKMSEYHRMRRSDPDRTPRNYEFQGVDRYGSLHDIYLTIQMIPGTKNSVASMLDITGRKAAKARIDHYNSVLLAIRDLNQLITHETDPVCLITQTPEV